MIDRGHFFLAAWDYIHEKEIAVSALHSQGAVGWDTMKTETGPCARSGPTFTTDG